MKLRDDEKRMLQGEEGLSVQKAMQLLVRIGDENGAEDMLDAGSAHILSIELSDILYELVFEQTKGAKVKIPTTTNSPGFNFEYAERMGISKPVIEDARSRISRLMQLHKDLGAMLSYTCSPHSFHHLRLGEHVSFTETQIVPMANAWFGARTNVESPNAAIASAITSKTANYGMHLTENRLGTALIEVAPDLEPERFDYADYTALSFWAGKILVDYMPVIPVYEGLSQKLTTYDKINHMCAHNTWNSGASMFHVVGVTPEARTVESAFGGRRPREKVLFGKKEMKNAYEDLTSATDDTVDVVSLGCPHCGLEELTHIAKLLEGKKVHENTQLWVGTSQMTKHIATWMGIVEAIENAGGLVISDACVSFYPIVALSPQVVATTSGLLSTVIPAFTSGKASVVQFGTTAQCINAAITGKWR